MTKKYWTKERHNPQLGIYFVGMGQLSKTAARKMGGPIYGSNVVLDFETKEEYEAALAKLKKQGERVQ